MLSFALLMFPLCSNCWMTSCCSFFLWFPKTLWETPVNGHNIRAHFSPSWTEIKSKSSAPRCCVHSSLLVNWRAFRWNISPNCSLQQKWLLALCESICCYPVTLSCLCKQTKTHNNNVLMSIKCITFQQTFRKNPFSFNRHFVLGRHVTGWHQYLYCQHDICLIWNLQVYTRTKALPLFSVIYKEPSFVLKPPISCFQSTLGFTLVGFINAGLC